MEAPAAQLPTRTYSVRQAAELLDVTEKTIRRWIADRRLPATRASGRQKPPWRIPSAAVDAVRPRRGHRFAEAVVGVPEASRALGVCGKTVRRWLESGRLYGVKRGGRDRDRWLIPQAEVDRMLRLRRPLR